MEGNGNLRDLELEYSGSTESQLCCLLVCDPGTCHCLSVPQFYGGHLSQFAWDFVLTLRVTCSWMSFSPR